MMLISSQLTLVVLLQLASTAFSLVQTRNEDPTFFNPPELTPILHLNPIVNFPTNSSDVYTVTVRVPNVGGNFSGIISGDVLAIGAATEVVAPEADGIKTFYENTFSLNTTDGIIISMFATATIHYANNALHGFGTVSFQTGDEQYRDLNYGAYVAEFAAVFGEYAFVDVFELATNGRKDGGRVPALEPPNVPA